MARRKITLDAEESRELQRRIKATTVAVRDRQRAEIIVLSAVGISQDQIASRVGVSRVTVNHWHRRFLDDRLAGLEDAAGRGRKPSLPPDAVRMVLDQAVTPPATLGRWSCRKMALKAGVSKATVQRLWAANDIKPHLWRTFKLSTDMQFESKFWDVIGLYLDPPEKALILCCDEEIAMPGTRAHPTRPAPGHWPHQDQDPRLYPHGTLTLFAALNYLEGKLITRIAQRHRHQEWLAFLKIIDGETPPGLDIHLIADNYATHKHAEVKRWLAKHPRFHMHFTPTSSSWLNLVERFFRDLTDFITEKSFASLGELSDAIIGFLAEHNKTAKPYLWRAKGEDILRKIEAARRAMATNQATLPC